MYKIIGGDGKEYGPISAEQLRRWISEGRVSAQTSVRLETDEGWRPLSSFPEFEAPSAPAPAAATLPPAKPPSAIKVFGIINIVFGGLGVLCTPLSLVALSFAAKQPGYQQPAMTPLWMNISLTLGFLGAVVMLVSGIGLCRFRSWARKLAVYYSIFALVFGIVSIFAQMKSGSTNAMPEQAKTVAMISMFFGIAISWTYNGLLIFFLSKAEVKKALGE